MVSPNRTSSRLPRGNVSGASGAGVGSVLCAAAGGACPDAVATAPGTACAAGAVPALFVHPARVADNAAARMVNAAIARERAQGVFMGEGLTRKGTSNPGFAMQYFSRRSVVRLRPFYNFWSMRSMKLWLTLAVLALAIAPLAAPLLAGSHPLTALLIRSFFSRLCHQNPARSFVVEGSPVAVCVRCLGIYSGFALAVLRLGKVPGRRLLAGAFLLNLLDVAGETLHWYGNLPLPRFLLGLALGIAAGAVLLSRQAELPARRSAG
jgi:hypothetical protein